MKTKTYKTYRNAIRFAYSAEPVFLSDSNSAEFAHLADIQATNEDLEQVAFSWQEGQRRTFSVFRLRTGDYGYRAIDLHDHKIAADRIFSTKDSAIDFLNRIKNRYLSEEAKAKGWREVSI